jgi:hypothetical protein
MKLQKEIWIEINPYKGTGEIVLVQAMKAVYLHSLLHSALDGCEW